MDKEAELFNELIDNSQCILITSHISPDPDAVSSVLLLGKTLQTNYPDKKINLVLEEEPLGLEYIDNTKQLRILSISEVLEEYKPDLFILLDGNSFIRCSRHNSEEVRQYITSKEVKTIVIDHHELAGADKVDLYINDNFPATVQNVYDLCFNILKMAKPEGYAKITMIGLYSDTGGFVYMKDGNHKDVFTLASELVDAGINIEEIKNLLNQFDDDDIKIIGELLNNTSHTEGYTYSFLSDSTVDNWLKKGKGQIELQRGTGSYLDEYVRNIGKRKWGFIVYKNTLQGDKFYSVSFRALSGSKDVSSIANRLGGGGHKPAAGAKFKAESIKQAIDIVKKTIDEG